jgi:hypothetical protein
MNQVPTDSIKRISFARFRMNHLFIEFPEIFSSELSVSARNKFAIEFCSDHRSKARRTEEEESWSRRTKVRSKKKKGERFFK